MSTDTRRQALRALSDTNSEAYVDGDAWASVGNPGWAAFLNTYVPLPERSADEVCHALDMLGIAFTAPRS